MQQVLGFHSGWEELWLIKNCQAGELLTNWNCVFNWDFTRYVINREDTEGLHNKQETVHELQSNQGFLVI